MNNKNACFQFVSPPEYECMMVLMQKIYMYIYICVYGYYSQL